MGFSSRNLGALLIPIGLIFFELQAVPAFPDEQFLAFPEEQLPAFPDEQLSASPDKTIDEQLHAGSDCESLLCADPLDLVNGIGNGLRNLWPFGNPVQPPNLLVPPKPQPKPGKYPGAIPDIPPVDNPQIENFQLAPNTDTQRCKPIAAPSNPDSADQQVSS